MERSGLFITFEGGEAGGKTTQIALLETYLKDSGFAVRKLREPGGTVIGEQLRHILKTPEYRGVINSRVELLLMEASRAQLVEEVIKPALDAGEVVLCDRFYDSTTAYQGFGRNFPDRVIDFMNDFAIDGAHPDLTMFFDVAPAVGLVKTLNAGREAVDRFEQEEAAFHQRVYDGYLTLAARFPQRIKTISYIDGGIAQMQAQIREHVDTYLSGPATRKTLARNPST